MRILMFGNTYSYNYNIPVQLAVLISVEIVHYTRGGTYLFEQLNAKTVRGDRYLTIRKDDFSEFVALRKMSNSHFIAKKTVLKNVSRLCEKILAVGATLVLFATWTYRKIDPKLSKLGMKFDILDSQLPAVNQYKMN